MVRLCVLASYTAKKSLLTPDQVFKGIDLGTPKDASLEDLYKTSGGIGVFCLALLNSVKGPGLSCSKVPVA